MASWTRVSNAQLSFRLLHVWFICHTGTTERIAYDIGIFLEKVAKSTFKEKVFLVVKAIAQHTWAVTFSFYT